MLDFESLDAGMERAVGLAPHALLAVASPPLASRFVLARERFAELAEQTDLEDPERIERDLLESFFGLAYGDRGLLARASALHLLQSAADSLGPRLQQADPSAIAAAERELYLLHTHVQLRVLGVPGDEALVHGSLLLHDRVATLQTAARALGGVDGGLRTAERAAWLYASDGLGPAMGALAGKGLGAALAWVASRLADSSFIAAERSSLDETLEAHVHAVGLRLRDEAIAGLARRNSLPAWSELQEVDHSIASLQAALTDRRREMAGRVQAVVALHTLLALLSAQAVARSAESARDAALLLLAEGLTPGRRKR